MLSVYRESEIAPFCRFAVGAFSVSLETEGTIMGISKKFTIIFVLSLACVLFACALVACNPSDSANNGQLPSDEEYVTVTFDTDGGSAVQAEKVKVGDRVALSGRIQSREYVKRLSETQSVTMTAYEVSVSKLAAFDEDEDFDLDSEFSLYALSPQTAE